MAAGSTAKAATTNGGPAAITATAPAGADRPCAARGGGPEATGGGGAKRIVSKYYFEPGEGIGSKGSGREGGLAPSVGLRPLRA